VHRKHVDHLLGAAIDATEHDASAEWEPNYAEIT
jgi:hypothetical protein